MERSAKKRRICDYYGTTTGPSCSHGMVTSSGDDYEVFLSFRGPDTRAGFTDFLYTSLTNARIRAFKDDEDLRSGEEFASELLQAINQSKISIPIFSKGYASSVWCLKELVQMVKCKKSGGHKIMPIFYDVAPSEVRYQTGGYGEALRSHEDKKRYDEKSIGQWKAALGEVSFLNGWDLHSMPNRREGEFARKLTQKVFNELKKAYLVVSDCLVNVDNHVDVIMERIGAGTNETRIIGIHGMGGLGKTTTAKIIYNKLSEDFGNCCFLRDIRETSKSKGGIQCLQNQLISDILKVNCVDIKDIDEGIQTIKDRLSNNRVLLLLDDVEEKNHIDALVGKHDWLGKGSKIIITTRNKDILEVPEVDCSYELSGMDPHQSLLLFSKHAFRRDSPLDEYIDQSNRAIGIANGLPLALEVIGSTLSVIEKEKWDLKLNKLENVPPEEVQRKLRISYDVLDVRQQHIFLDIACLLIGYDKDIVVHFWNESKYPEEAMEVLQNMSLIKIRNDKKVWMHDQLRDLGREIVHQESKMKIEEQTRVWDPMEALELLELLKSHEGKTKVEALRLSGQYHFTYEDFKRLSNLKLLEVDRWQGDITAEESLLWNEWASNGLPTNVFQENSYLLPQLRWLSWRRIPPTFNITKFSMKNVVILDLSSSEITDDWEGWSHMKVMKNLKILDLSRCKHLKRTPNFSSHSKLERLILTGCSSLSEIDSSICQLKRLIYLDVSSCGKLQKLPDELGRDLASLEYLSLDACENLERLPETIGNLESLIMLDISGTRIKEVPDSIGKLKNLKVVRIRGSHIRKIPDALWTIEKIEEIIASEGNIRDHFHVKIGNCIYRNQSLRILSCTDAIIFELPRLPESLLELRLSKLDMGTFPDLSNLINLKELDLVFEPRDYEKPNGLEEVPIPRWVGDLSKLESLRLDSDFVTTSPTDLSLPPQLKSLYLYCRNLRRLPTLPSSLSYLHLFCNSLRSMEDLSHLKKLSSLQISGATITEIPDLGCLENLGDLWLGNLKRVEILPDLSNLNRLRSLHVSFCDNLVEIQGELPQSLEELNIYSCESLQKLPNMSSLMRLRHVCICACGNLVEIQGELPQSLEILEIDSCGSLQKLPCLPSFVGLRYVSIRKCGNLVEIQGDLPQSLADLDISSCKSLQELPNMSSLRGLRDVFISACGNLVEIQGKLPQSLGRLVIDSCKSLQKLPYLSSSMRL